MRGPDSSGRGVSCQKSGERQSPRVGLTPHHDMDTYVDDLTDLFDMFELPPVSLGGVRGSGLCVSGGLQMF